MTIDDGIRSLARLAEARGCVTYDDVNETFPDTIFFVDQLDEIYIKLKVLGIEIIDQAD